MIVEQYDRLCMLLIEKARRKIAVYLYAFELRYEKPWGLNLKQLEDKLESVLEIILPEPEEDDQTADLRRITEQKIKSPVTENADRYGGYALEQTRYEQFRSALKLMINSLTESAAGMLYTCADEARTEITRSAAQLMDGYFAEILSVLQKIEINMERTQRAYVME